MSTLKSFLYFAYGSNLLAQRIHIANPSAVRRNIGKLLDYRLDFNYYSQRWKGCAATVVPDNQNHVWGAIWELDNEHIESLDKQEGVHRGIYKVIHVDIITPEGERLNCRCYRLTDQPPALNENEEFPPSRYPSKIYLDTIIAGAKESNLPNEYIEFLQSFPDNGFDGIINLTTELHKLD